MPEVHKKTWHPCTSCCGIGYTNHQRLFEDGYELDRERDCLICNGVGQVYS